MAKHQVFFFDLKRLMSTCTNLIIILFVLLNSAGCSGKMKQEKNIQTRSAISTEIPETSESRDSIIFNQYKSGGKEGLWRVFYDNGQMKSEGNYRASLKEGLHKEWSENGILLLSGFYEKGKANGLMQWFHERGHLAGEGNMIDDVRVGPWKICDIQENGFCIEAYFNNDKREGVWRIYHDNANSKLWKEQTFKNDRMVSEKCWDKNNNLIQCE